jgi:SPP1 family predicted phage head-tail adaptor
MPAGKRRHLVTIQSPADGADSSGGLAKTWTNLTDRWVRLRPLNGQERMLAQQTQTRVDHEITIEPIIASLHAGMRFVYPRLAAGVTDPPSGSRIFQLEGAVQVDERGKMQVAEAREEVP